jgi:hypothetical protein
MAAIIRSEGHLVADYGSADAARALGVDRANRQGCAFATSPILPECVSRLSQRSWFF